MTPVEAVSERAKISFKVLIGFYAVVPLCLIFYLFDSNLFNNYLRLTLPRSPESLVVFSVLFGAPHIVASNFIFITNQEYRQKFGRRALWATLAIVAFFGLGSLYLHRDLIFFIVATITITHVVKQQIGIGNIQARLSGIAYQCWVWTMIGASVIMFNAILLRHIFPFKYLYVVDLFLLAAGVFIFSLNLVLHSRAATSTGRQFLWANSILILMSFFLYTQKYYFFAILGPRLVHDATAFLFYTVHDYNRHHHHPQNRWYQMLEKAKLSAFVAVPALAIIMTFFLQEFADPFFSMATQAVLGKTFPKAIAVGFLGYLGMMHYYMEAFTWKHDSPYRRFISF